MASATKIPLSGSTDGRGILIAATATPGTLLHTAQAGVLGSDEVFVFAVNSQASSVKVTLEWGGVTSPNDLIEQDVPGESGLFLLAPGIVLRNGLVIRAFAATGNVVVAFGYVNQITN